MTLYWQPSLTNIYKNWILEIVCSRRNLKVNVGKSKVMRSTRRDDRAEIRISIR